MTEHSPSAAAPEPTQEAAAPAVVVARTIGGVVLAVIGAVATIAGALWLFVVPWFGWARDDIWGDLAEWSDVGGAVIGIGGFALLVIGAALIQRARKKKFEVLLDASTLAPPPTQAPPPPPPIL